MPELREHRPRAAVPLALTLSAFLAGSLLAQDVVRLPDTNFVARQPEHVAPGLPAVPGYSPSRNAAAGAGGPSGQPLPQPPGATSGYEEPTTMGSPVPLGQSTCPPPSQGQTALAYGPSSELPWSWHLLPTGLMYRSYLAGVKEPRIGTSWLHDGGLGPVHDRRTTTPFVGTVWDSTLGARVGLLRYGTPNAYRPEGFQIDLTGSAQPRLNPFANSTPLLACDYTIGLPITYARGKWQYKTGYNHLSSHMGDELIVSNPAFAALRNNYVRDSIMLGVGCYVTDNLRLFGEFDYAIGLGGGSEPVELQWGADYSPARPGGAPFVAFYGNQRQELNYGGFFVVQAGWQWRGGLTLSTLRIGLEYFNGKSSQWEFYKSFEQRIGWGIWYDF